MEWWKKRPGCRCVDVGCNKILCCPSRLPLSLSGAGLTPPPVVDKLRRLFFYGEKDCFMIFLNEEKFICSCLWGLSAALC